MLSRVIAKNVGMFFETQCRCFSPHVRSVSTSNLKIKFLTLPIPYHNLKAFQKCFCHIFCKTRRILTKFGMQYFECICYDVYVNGIPPRLNTIFNITLRNFKFVLLYMGMKWRECVLKVRNKIYFKIFRILRYPNDAIFFYDHRKSLSIGSLARPHTDLDWGVSGKSCDTSF